MLIVNMKLFYMNFKNRTKSFRFFFFPFEIFLICIYIYIHIAEFLILYLNTWELASQIC